MSTRTGQAPTVPIHGDGRWTMPPPGSRSAEEVRRDIVQHRQQLSRSVDALRTRLGEATNVRRQISEHRTELLVGAAAVGFLVGALALRRRRRS
jgi:Protein of unknown function (DUF3618)